MKKDDQVKCRCDSETRHRLEMLAQMEERSLSDVVRRAVRSYWMAKMANNNQAVSVGA